MRVFESMVCQFGTARASEREAWNSLSVEELLMKATLKPPRGHHDLSALGRWALLALTAWGFAFPSNTALAATAIVSTLADSGAGSLRAAIAGANPGDVISFAVSGMITNLTGELLIDKDLSIIGPGTTNLAISGNQTGRVFNIASGVTVSFSGTTIRDGHASDGAASTNYLIPGGAGDNGGGIYNAGTLTVTNCVITLCRAGDGGAGYPSVLNNGVRGGDGGPGGSGGGIYNTGALALAGCTLDSNTGGSGGNGGVGAVSLLLTGGRGGAGGRGGSGGGIYNRGALSITTCTFSSNNTGNGGTGGAGGSGPTGGSAGAGGDGGVGGGLGSETFFSLISSTFNGNGCHPGGMGGIGGSGKSGGPGGNGGAGGKGGGVYSLASFALVSCTLVGNLGGYGGHGGNGGGGGSGGNGGNGGNAGGGGGACTATNAANCLNVLAAQNAVETRGGTYGFGGSGSPAGQQGAFGLPGAGPDFLGSFSSQGHNLVGAGDGSTGLTNGTLGDLVGSTNNPIDPLLGAWQNNWGPTFTYGLLAGSPAIDAGDDSVLGPVFGLTTDQRGLPRKSGAHVDIGAFEVQWASGSTRITAFGATTNGAFQLGLTNLPGASLTILATTNAALPPSAWTAIGSAIETAPGQFEFSDAGATNFAKRFYLLRSP